MAETKRVWAIQFRDDLMDVSFESFEDAENKIKADFATLQNRVSGLSFDAPWDHWYLTGKNELWVKDVGHSFKYVVKYFER